MATAHRLFVPGRIEVLGKHTDYAGGRSLLVAVDRGFTASARAAPDDTVRITDTRRGETVMVDAATGRTGSGLGWAVYPATVVRRLARDFPGAIGGCRIELAGDLPAASGLSSSSALITTVFLALDAVYRIADTDAYRAAIPDRESLAGYLGAVERGSPFPGLGGADSGVGTRGGSEDHVAMLCARPDHLIRYRYEPVAREGAVPMPAGHIFAVATSGVRAEKKGAARARYNRLSDTAARAAALWREAGKGEEPHLGGILESGGIDPLLDVVHSADDGDDLARRVHHFAAESGEIVPAAFSALAAGDLPAFGRLADRSQALAEELLGNQVPETIHLARTARELGAPAASAFGAGFGGSVWALVSETDARDFLGAWRDRYLAAFPTRDQAELFTTPAARPAHSL